MKSFATVTAASRERHLADLIQLATTPGLQRDRAKAVLEKLKDGYAFTVSYGKGKARIAGNGDVYTGRLDESETAIVLDEKTYIHDDPAGMEVGLSSALTEIVVPGSAPANKIVGSMHIPCGVCVIVAGGGRGKTPLAHALASAGVEAYGAVRVGESFAGYTTNRILVARALGGAMVAHSDIVLDSIKDLLAEDGAAMKGGISRAALLDLSAWATQAAALGCTIYVPLNPSGDQDLIQLMIEVAKSNATMTVAHSHGSSWSYSSRTGEGLERISGMYDFAKSRPENNAATRADRDMTVKFDAGHVDRETFAGLLARSRSI